MKTLLQIKSSLFSAGGQSSRLAERFVAAWRVSNPDGQVIVRDLALEPVPHLDAARFGAFLAKPGERSAAQQAVIEHSDALIDELKRAEVIVLGLPISEATKQQGIASAHAEMDQVMAAPRRTVAAVI